MHVYDITLICVMIIFMIMMFGVIFTIRKTLRIQQNMLKSYKKELDAVKKKLEIDEKTINNLRDIILEAYKNDEL